MKYRVGECFSFRSWFWSEKGTWGGPVAFTRNKAGLGFKTFTSQNKEVQAACEVSGITYLELGTIVCLEEQAPSRKSQEAEDIFSATRTSSLQAMQNFIILTGEY